MQILQGFGLSAASGFRNEMCSWRRRPAGSGQRKFRMTERAGLADE